MSKELDEIAARDAAASQAPEGHWFATDLDSLRLVFADRRTLLAMVRELQPLADNCAKFRNEAIGLRAEPAALRAQLSARDAQIAELRDRLERPCKGCGL